MSDKEPFPREVDVPVKSSTSSINWKAKPCKDTHKGGVKRNMTCDSEKKDGATEIT